MDDERDGRRALKGLSAGQRVTNRHVYRSIRHHTYSHSCSHVGVFLQDLAFTLLVMTSRINIARPAGRGGYSPDPHGLSTNRPASAGFRAANPDDPLDKVRHIGKQVEDTVEIYAQPLKPHLPAVGRFLIVVTFIEDSIRILTQWSDQLWYLQK